MNTDEKYISEIITNSSGSSKFSTVMLSNFLKWESFPLEFWLNALNDIKNTPLSLYSYLPFAYKILGINLIDVYWNLEDIKEATRVYIADALREDHRLLYLSPIEINIIKRENISLLIKLIELKKRLVKQGGIPINFIWYWDKNKTEEVFRDEFFIECYNNCIDK